MKKHQLILVAVVMAVAMAGIAEAADTPAVGWSTSAITVNAYVKNACVESTHGAFGTTFLVDTQSGADQEFDHTTDESVTCTNGGTFVIHVSSAGGLSVDGVCGTSSSTATMAMTTADNSDTLPYTLECTSANASGQITGTGLPQALGLKVKVLASDLASIKAHQNYTDAITLTMEY